MSPQFGHVAGSSRLISGFTLFGCSDFTCRLRPLGDAYPLSVRDHNSFPVSRAPMLKAGYFSAPLIDALLILNLRLDDGNCVTGLHLQCDGLAREGLYENLHLVNVRDYFLRREKACDASTNHATTLKFTYRDVICFPTRRCYSNNKHCYYLNYGCGYERPDLFGWQY